MADNQLLKLLMFERLLNASASQLKEWLSYTPIELMGIKMRNKEDKRKEIELRIIIMENIRSLKLEQLEELCRVLSKIIYRKENENKGDITKSMTAKKH